MACNMEKLANFSVEKQQLIATCVDSYTGELSNFVAADVDTNSGSIDSNIRDRFEKEILVRSGVIVLIVSTRMIFLRFWKLLWIRLCLKAGVRMSSLTALLKLFVLTWVIRTSSMLRITVI